MTDVKLSLLDSNTCNNLTMCEQMSQSNSNDAY